ncbi:uncharacterized protein LOC126776530 [Nymphalis io]|uniref:uncharacterized protein LOC126776530 n=1 Tax=Inachis io TaxID=171585 RepID=UPI00216910E3|nr:uncharacterized protein LOC126776530 [Nymphalis io]
MAHRNVYQRLGYRISEEVQLLAEEKWIVEALTKIKNQRNCLQIERLHLESLKAKIKGNTKKDVAETRIKDNENSIATTSAVSMMQHVNTGKSDVETEKKVFSVTEAFCNEEELDLMVTDPILLANPSTSDFNMEEDEDESDDDMFIDMNMLMNGNFQSRKKYDQNQ